jgi:hypothetical protein
MKSSGVGIDERELDLLIALLDVDLDGTVNYEEFEHIYHSLDDKKSVQSLEPVIRDILLKLRYSSLPDPEKYLYMFQGMPTNFRLSALTSVEEKFESSLSQVSLTNGASADSSGLKFDVQILNVSGVPSETSGRQSDMLIRGVKFCVCRCGKIPTDDSAGEDPDFVGNVVKLHATLSSKNADVWKFSNKEDTGYIIIFIFMKENEINFYLLICI